MISIITAAYNCEKYLEKAIQSVLAQAFQDWEMLIVDDMSTDTTAEIAQRYAQSEPRIKLIKSTQKLFSAAARNLATQHASGQYIAFLDADDYWHPAKLSTQYEFMQANDYALSYTSYQIFNSEGVVHPYVVQAQKKVTYQDLFYYNPIGCLTVMYDSAKVGKLLFPTDFVFQEDYVLWIQTLQQSQYAFYGIPASLACYRIHPKNRSGNKWKVAKYHWHYVYKRCFDWNFFQKIYYFSFYIAKSLMKYSNLRT